MPTVPRAVSHAALRSGGAQPPATGENSSTLSPAVESRPLPEDVGAAVLIRALEPTAGLDAMRLRRRLDRVEDLCSGPGKLTQALGIELHHDETDLLGGGPITLEPPAGPVPRLVTGPRIGITRAAELPWRFCEAGNRCVSKPWPMGLVPARRSRRSRG